MEISGQNEISKYDMETDISKLEAPTFTTIDRSNAPMLSLDWDHQVNLVGKKVVNPMIHSCDKCLKPILIYGRMIPCKHVFCLGCAKQEERSCPRCGDKVVRVEQAGLGNIFLCTSGGSRWESSCDVIRRFDWVVLMSGTGTVAAGGLTSAVGTSRLISPTDTVIRRTRQTRGQTRWPRTIFVMWSTASARPVWPVSWLQSTTPPAPTAATPPASPPPP